MFLLKAMCEGVNSSVLQLFYRNTNIRATPETGIEEVLPKAEARQRLPRLYSFLTRLGIQIPSVRSLIAGRATEVGTKINSYPTGSELSVSMDSICSLFWSNNK